VKGLPLLRDGRAAVAVAVDDAYPFAFVLAGGPVSVDPAAPDLLDWCTRIAARYVPAGQADAFGRRNAVAGELLVRLHPQRLVGEDDVAGPGRRE